MELEDLPWLLASLTPYWALLLLNVLAARSCREASRRPWRRGACWLLLVLDALLLAYLALLAFTGITAREWQPIMLFAAAIAAALALPVIIVFILLLWMYRSRFARGHQAPRAVDASAPGRSA